MTHKAIMEALLTSSADIRKEENESKALLVSDKGKIYRVDLESGEIKWFHDTKEPIYKKYRARGVVEYVDIGLEDDEYPYYYSVSRRPKVIPPGEDMGKYIQYFFKEDQHIDVRRYEFYLNFSTGKRSEKDGQDMMSITRTDFEISIPNRWSFMYSNLDAFFPSSEKSSKCLVIYGRTPESFIEICNKYRLGHLPGGGILARTINLGKRISLNKFVNKKGNISFFLGYLRDSKVCYEVFVKRVPKMDGYLQVLDVYKKIGHSQYLARLLSVESDDEYEYLAFEYNKQYTSLANIIISADDSEIQPAPLDYSDIIQRASILRHVIRGLMDLHASGVLHCNITRDHVLVKANPYGGYAIKFCGFRLSKPCVAEDKFNVSDSHMVERQNLARLIVNMMTSLSDNVEHTGIPDGYQYQPLNKNALNKYMNMNKTTNVVRDLVLKLMNADYKMDFMEVYNHLLFWSWHEQLMLLKEASDEIFARTLTGIEDAAPTVFDGNWESKIIEKGGENWLKKMKEVPEEVAKMKEVYEESEDRKEEENRKEVHKKNGRGGGSGRGRGGRHGKGGNGKAEGGNGKAEGDKAKRSVYNPKSLRDLLRLVRNGVDHRCKGEYPGDNLLELWEFLHDAFPDLFTVVYNHVLKNGKGTKVYVNYCRKPFM